jgi:hypothetical protein
MGCTLVPDWLAAMLEWESSVMESRTASGGMMENDWKEALAHESGHALMAILHDIPCHGICFQREIDGGQFCALLGSSPEERSYADYLVSAAGVAAELLIYPNQTSSGAEADCADFASAPAPTFEETVGRAKAILAREKSKLDRLIGALNDKLSSVGFDLSLLPETGMDGSTKRYLILLSQDELNTCLLQD